MADEPQKIPTWALMVFALLCFVALFWVIQDPGDRIKDDSQPTYATLVSGVMTAICGPAVLKRL